MSNTSPRIGPQRLIISACMLALMTAACSSEALLTAPSSSSPSPASAVTRTPVSPLTPHDASDTLEAARHLPDNCTFSSGTTTCITTVTRTETTTHAAISGCLYGPNRAPGRRSRTFEDTYLITDTTTTLQHGNHGAVYDTSTETSRELLTSRQVSDVCEPV